MSADGNATLPFDHPQRFFLYSNIRGQNLRIANTRFMATRSERRYESNKVRFGNSLPPPRKFKYSDLVNSAPWAVIEIEYANGRVSRDPGPNELALAESELAARVGVVEVRMVARKVVRS